MKNLFKSLILLIGLSPTFLFGQLKKTVSFDGAGTSVSGLFQVYEYPSQTGNPSGCTTNSSAISQSTGWAADGTKSAYITLNYNNCLAQYGNTRAEFTQGNYTPTQSGYDTTLRWWVWSWYFPSATNVADSKEWVAAQWHDKAISPLTCSTSPPLAIEVKNGRFRAMIRYNVNNPYCGNTGSNVLQIFDLGPVPLNKRLDFIVNYYPTANTDGYARIYINDTLKLNYSGRCMFYGSAFPYFKTGIYKWLWDGTASSTPTDVGYYMDAFKIYGALSTYADVDQTPAGGGGGSNNPPVVSAGPNQVVSNSTTTGSLSGASASDPDAGNTLTYSWSQLSGPNTATFSSTTALNPTLSGLIAGTYSFRLTATDNNGASSSATMTFRVNLSPILDVTGNTGLTSLISTTTSVGLISSSSDPDGSVVSWSWVQVEGAASTITSPTSANTTITGLTPGTRRYLLTVTDNNGDTDVGEVEVTILNLTIISIKAKGYKSVKVN